MPAVEALLDEDDEVDALPLDDSLPEVPEVPDAESLEPESLDPESFDSLDAAGASAEVEVERLSLR